MTRIVQRIFELADDKKYVQDLRREGHLDEVRALLREFKKAERLKYRDGVMHRDEIGRARTVGGGLSEKARNGAKFLYSPEGRKLLDRIIEMSGTKGDAKFTEQDFSRWISQRDKTFKDLEAKAPETMDNFASTLAHKYMQTLVKAAQQVAQTPQFSQPQPMSVWAD